MAFSKSYLILSYVLPDILRLITNSESCIYYSSKFHTHKIDQSEQEVVSHVHYSLVVVYRYSIIVNVSKAANAPDSANHFDLMTIRTISIRTTILSVT